jgi:hypothetical protein
VNIEKWIRQPTTIHGLAVLAAGAGAALAHVTTGNHVVDAVIAVAAYVGIHLGIDDHSTAEAGMSALVNDLVSRADPGKTIADASAAATALTPTATS